MSIWDFIGVNKIGPGHPRYERGIRKAREHENLIIRVTCMTIITEGISNALEIEEEKHIIYVLKRFPKCPVISDEWGKVRWGNKNRDIFYWKQAQKWLRDKEQEEEALYDDLNGVETKNEIKHEAKNETKHETKIEYIKKLEARMKKLEEKLNQYEKE